MQLIDLPTISNEWIPAVSGAIGASGAVGAQIVAAVFTGRREKRAATNRLREARTELFRNEKLALLTSIHEIFDRQAHLYKTYLMEIDAGDKVATVPTGATLSDEWGSVVAQTNLIAPEVAEVTNHAREACRLFEMSIGAHNLDMAKQNISNLSGFRSLFIAQARDSLGTRATAKKK